MTPTNEQAVFLSYASQDTDAVQHMVEALRAGGVNVWFDRLELVGGDAWDRKIKKQIADCTLFIPVISANTQARSEGYFRLEWHLAEQRSLLIAKGQPFIVPVSLDGVRESAALVPDAFTAVQWTSLPRGETPVEFVERIQRILARQERIKTTAATSGTPKELARSRSRSRRSVIRAWAIGALCAFALALAVKVMIGTGGEAPKTAQPSSSTPTSNTVAGNFIAVLPFVSRSADEAAAQSNAFFTDGVHENILTHLSNIPDLRVVSRTSVMQYKNNTASVPDIRAELGVSHILEGSVQRIGSSVQVNVQLIDARIDSRLWARSFEKDVTDIFAIQAEVAKAIAAELKTMLTPEQQQQIERLPTENKEALALFINASQLNTFSEQQNKAAIALLEQAIKLDPGFVLAYTRLAHLYLMHGTRQSQGIALDYAQTAAALDPKSARAQHALATSTMSLGKLDEARFAFQRAIELDPNFSSAMNDLSVLEAFAGRMDQSFYWAGRSLPLAPNVSYSYYHTAVPMLTLDFERTRQFLRSAVKKFSPPNRSDSGVHRLHTWLAHAELYGGNPAAAMKIIEDLIAEHPQNMEVQANYSEMCWLAGADCAQAQIEPFLANMPDQRLTTQGYSARTIQAYLWLKAGKSEEAQKLIVTTMAANDAAISAGGDRSAGPLYENAALSHMKGDHEAALVLIERAVEAGFGDPYAMAVDPILAPLANEDRFKRLQTRLHERLRDMRTRIDFRDIDAFIASGRITPRE